MQSERQLANPQLIRVEMAFQLNDAKKVVTHFEPIASKYYYVFGVFKIKSSAKCTYATLELEL